jgi:hypothetical protein
MDLAKHQNNHVGFHARGSLGSLLAPVYGNNSPPVREHNNNFAEAVGKTNNRSLPCAGEIYKLAATRKWSKCDIQCWGMKNPTA